MPAITIRLQPHSTRARQTQYTCRLAGSLIHLDALPAELAPFHVETGIRPAPTDPIPPPVIPQTPPISRLRAFLHNRERDITCWAAEDGYLLAIEGGGLFSIDAAGTRITHLSAGEAGLDRGAVVIGMIGPALAIALAHQGVYVMHCSTVRHGDGVILFLGNSGEGKSTLSAYLHGMGWDRLGDDGMPVTLRGSVAIAMPHYPQLKLGRQEQIALDAPDSLPIRAIYTLDSADASADPAILPLTYRDAARALIFHTSAVSLFAPPLLVAHAAAMTRIAASVPIKRLIYPHRWGVMDRVRGVIEGELT